MGDMRLFNMMLTIVFTMSTVTSGKDFEGEFGESLCATVEERSQALAASRANGGFAW